MLSIYTSKISKTVYIDFDSKIDIHKDSVNIFKSTYEPNKFNIWFMYPINMIYNVDAIAGERKTIPSYYDLYEYDVIIHNIHTDNKELGKIGVISANIAMIRMNNPDLIDKYNFAITYDL